MDEEYRERLSEIARNCDAKMARIERCERLEKAGKGAVIALTGTLALMLGGLMLKILWEASPVALLVLIGIAAVGAVIGWRS